MVMWYITSPMSRKRLHSPGPAKLRKSKRFWIEPRGQEEFAIGKGRSVLLSLRHAVAANIYKLLYLRIVEKACWDENFNCHAATAIALGESTEIAWGGADYRGDPMDVEEALAELPLPCGMQIHDSEEFRVVLHSAVLLGKSSRVAALAFHKNGHLPMELCPVSDIIATYRKHHFTGTLTFYAPRLIPSP